jgi:D-alanyl-D-alanine carboxypeptidase/D-alanyl-D-alanine-endopeptidase (penicillin-binding protein 4)
MKRIRLLFICRVVTALVLCLLPASSFCPHAQARDPFGIEKLIGSTDAVLVAGPDGKIIYSKNMDQKLVPASALKVFTALTALHYLGPDYRFRTEFYVDGSNNLIIKGYGDPLLVSEAVKKISEQVAQCLPAVEDIVLDDAFFVKPIDIPGASTLSRNPYNAPNGALCVNFNTVYFTREKGILVSAEPQTPLLPLALKRIRGSNPDAGRITFSFDGDEITTYAGEMFIHFFREAGMKVTGGLRLGRVNPAKDRLIFRHASEYSVTDIIERLLKYSNNYIANQLLISIGASVYGPPGTLEKGVAAANGYASEILGIREIVIAEGSGLSRKNRASATMFYKMLDVFAPYHALMPTEGSDFYKTGTLSGIRTRVGYIRTGSGDLYRYVILLNTPDKTVDPIIRRIISHLH